MGIIVAWSGNVRERGSADYDGVLGVESLRALGRDSLTDVTSIEPEQSELELPTVWAP